MYVFKLEPTYGNLNNFIEKHILGLLKLKHEVLRTKSNTSEGQRGIFPLPSSTFEPLVMYLIKEWTVGGFLADCMFLLISYSDVHSGVDVHTYQLLSLYHINIHLKQDIRLAWRS